MLITPVPEAPLLSVDFVRHCLGVLGERGYSRVITGALSPLEQAAFLAAGFDVEADLRLLEIDIQGGLPPLTPGSSLRRVPKRRWDDVLAVDGAAFEEFWRFDDYGLADALRATPSVRFRRAVGPGAETAGYAVCGVARQRGFVQRLAVHPAAQGHGTGRRLLLDGLHWMRRQGVLQAMVNTQTRNEAAVSLYQSVGFKEQSSGLSVLSAGLD